MDLLQSAKRKAAILLETGALSGEVFGYAARIWERRAARTVARPLMLPARVVSVGVGGATLGGSYRTPLALAVSEHLAARGEKVALIGHAYGARRSVARARVINQGDDPRDVGDESLLCARQLGRRARVVIGPSRQAAVDHAALLGATALVFDGLLDARPTSLDISILALDAHAPWGAGRAPPLGDLRAEPEVLLRHARMVVTFGVATGERRRVLPSWAVPVDRSARFDGVVRVVGARPLGGHATLPLDALRGLRLGLSTSIARPERLVRCLAAEGLTPAVVVSSPDHGPPRFPNERVDAWLITEKCAVWADSASHLPPQLGAQMPIHVLRSELQVPARFWQNLGARMEAKPARVRPLSLTLQGQGP